MQATQIQKLPPKKTGAKDKAWGRCDLFLHFGTSYSTPTPIY